MDSELHSDTFGFDNDTCFSSILEDLQDKPNIDFSFGFTESVIQNSCSFSDSSKRVTGQKRKMEADLWDFDFNCFLPSSDCNFASTYTIHEEFTHTTNTDTKDHIKVKTLETGCCIDRSETDLCTTGHVNKKLKLEEESTEIFPNVASPPFTQRPISSPSAPQKSTKRRSRDFNRRSTPIPILCPDSQPSPVYIPTLCDPTIPHIFEFRKTISELDSTSRLVYRDTLLQLAKNAEAGIFEPSPHNNGQNFESLLMRMMFSFSVPSIHPSYFSASSLDRSVHLVNAGANYFNNAQFVPIVSSRNTIRGVDPKHLTEVHSFRDPFFTKNTTSASLYNVPNFNFLKSLPLSPPSTSPATSPTPVSSPSFRQNDSKQILSRHLPIRVL